MLFGRAAIARQLGLAAGIACRRCGGELEPDPDRRAERACGVLVYERVLPAVPLSVRRARRELDQALSDLCVRAAGRADVALVVSEAATNSVLHAYVGQRPGPLVVAAAVHDRDLSVDVSDCGRGPLPRADSAGLGLSLMRNCSDALTIAAAFPDTGTRVSALFRRATDRNGAPGGSDHVHRTITARTHARALSDYAEALAATNGWLQEDTRALMAEARQALARARQLRAERPRRIAPP